MKIKQNNYAYHIVGGKYLYEPPPPFFQIEIPVYGNQFWPFFFLVQLYYYTKLESLRVAEFPCSIKRESADIVESNVQY